MIDGSKAAVHLLLTTQHTPSGRTVETELMDLFEFDEEEKVTSMVEFVDTAMTQGLQADA